MRYFSEMEAKTKIDRIRNQTIDGIKNTPRRDDRFSSVAMVWERYTNEGWEIPYNGVTSYRVFNLKVDRILIWVIYLLRFTTCYITQLTCIYSKCWKWCPFISMHLSTRFTMVFAIFFSVLSFTSSMARVIFIFKILNYSKKLYIQWA